MARVNGGKIIDYCIGSYYYYPGCRYRLWRWLRNAIIEYLEGSLGLIRALRDVVFVLPKMVRRRFVVIDSRILLFFIYYREVGVGYETNCLDRCVNVG